MGGFIIKPQMRQSPRIYDDTFLWKESQDELNIYIMINHRLSLWCWLQCKDIFNRKHSIIFIDEHADAREWFNGEELQLKKILKDFKVLRDYETYNSFQCANANKCIDDREKRPCIIWDNFIYLVVQEKLFKHYYLHSPAFQWDINKEMNSNPEKFDVYEKRINMIKHLESNIIQSNDKCIVDIDLDFFDKIKNKDELLQNIFKTVKKYSKSISCITIALTDSPSDTLWNCRQNQLKIIKRILEIDIPILIIKS